MFDFLLPTYVVAKWSTYNNDYEFLCTFNRHFVYKLEVATHFYFEFTAKRTLRKYIRMLRRLGLDAQMPDYEVVDYRELGYTSEDARATSKYTFG